MRRAVAAWLDMLDPTQQAQATFSFDTPERRGWNFMLGSRRAPGLALEHMQPDQKRAALDILASSTSAIGFEKAENIMLQQDILRDEWGKGSADRNRERFCLQVYGTPTAKGAWAWRWEGHHLSLTFTMVDDEVVSTTPSAFSSEPNTVPSGPHKGLIVLKDEEAIGRKLFSDLRGVARRGALLSDRAPGNIQSTFGAEERVAAQTAGLPVGDMQRAQGDLVKRLLSVYTTEVLPRPLALQQADRLAEEEMDAMRFAWAGTDTDRAVYYRLTGRDLLIEFASLRNQPLHLHAVFHDLRRNFGDHVLAPT